MSAIDTVKTTARDLQLALKAKRAGADNALRIIWEARRANVPVSWLFAIVEQESNFKNIFGCDQGSILCHQAVTKERVQRLINHVRGGGISNGVGFTQLTSLDYILRAEHYGGAHIPKNQIRCGAEVLREKTGGDMNAAWRYNGNLSYQRQIEAKQKRWHKILS